MDIKDPHEVETDLQALAAWYDETKGVGHTFAAMHAATNLPIHYVTFNEQHSRTVQASYKQLFKGPGSNLETVTISGLLRGIRKHTLAKRPLVFDNLALTAIFSDAATVITHLIDQRAIIGAEYKQEVEAHTVTQDTLVHTKRKLAQVEAERNRYFYENAKLIKKLAAKDKVIKDRAASINMLRATLSGERRKFAQRSK